VIVIDSSAVIALMFGEPGADRLAERLAQEPVGHRVISVVNYVEAGTVLAGRNLQAPERGKRDLDDFLKAASIELTAANSSMAVRALEARVKFGKGFASAAKLNFGDCFAYALAKEFDAPLLFVGDDFAATDVTTAL
jgi:ribonuclease VapC